MSEKKLSQLDYFKAAEILKVEPAVIYAVKEIESSGSGFDDEGNIKLLFEAHIFSYYTNHKYDQTHPQISSPVWNRQLYKGGKLELQRLAAAMKLDPTAALMSASYGLFQIMGFNHRLVGYSDVTSFYSAMCESEFKQLEAFIKFIQVNKLDDELREKRWKDFARVYNGPGYAANQYDVKLQNSYEKWNKILTAHG